MTKKLPTETTSSPSFDDLISDLRQEYIVEATTASPKQLDRPKEGKEIKLGHKLPQWAYIGIFGAACTVALLAVFMFGTTRQESSTAQANNDPITAVSNDQNRLPVTFAPPPAPTEAPSPATPTAAALPALEAPIPPEPTNWPDPPTATPIPIPETG